MDLRENSRFYNIEPIGIGTPFLESLTSYIIRLAEKHCVTPGTLVGKEITPLLNKHYLYRTAERGGSGIYKSSSSINGVKVQPIEITKVIEKLTTRNGLIFTTLFPLAEVLTPRGLLKEKKAWCPFCHEEDKPLYEPLYWFVKEVNICLLHMIPLETSCPSCKKEIPVLSRNTQHGHCSSCGIWLGKKNKELNVTSNDIDSYEYWKTKCIGELVGSLTELEKPPKSDRIQMILSKIETDSAKELNANFIKMANIPNSTFRSWLLEGKIPSLSNLLKISYCLGLTLKQLLIEDIDSSTFSYRAFPIQYETNNLKVQRFPTNYVERQLKYWANIKLQIPPSLKEVASHIGCDKRLLYSRNYELSKQISQKYTRYINTRAKERIEIAKKKISDAVRELNQQGVYPSRRKIEEFLGMPGIIREKIVRDVWNEELNKLR